MQSLEVKSAMLEIPSKWQKKYFLKRIGEEDLVIPLNTRNNILEQLDKGGKYVQIGEYTIMLNSIKSIDPYWPDKNIPPRPPMKFNFNVFDNKTTAVKKEILNKEEIDEWDKYFSKKTI